MAVTDILVAEHETVLAWLSELASAADAGRREEIRRLLPFFEENLQVHRRKEEEVLFPAVARQIGESGGPVACMLEEHRQEKQLIAAIREVLEGGEGLSRPVGLFVEFLRLHIQKENEVLFPLAEQVLSIAEKEPVFTAMRKIGSCCDVCVR